VEDRPLPGSPAVGRAPDVEDAAAEVVGVERREPAVIGVSEGRPEDAAADARAGQRRRCPGRAAVGGRV